METTKKTCCVCSQETPIVVMDADGACPACAVEGSLEDMGRYLGKFTALVERLDSTGRSGASKEEMIAAAQKHIEIAQELEECAAQLTATLEDIARGGN